MEMSVRAGRTGTFQQCYKMLSNLTNIIPFPFWFSGRNCKNLSGAWYNQLGSEMLVTHNILGEFSGEYRTSVERESGAAGNSYSLVVGK